MGESQWPLSAAATHVLLELPPSGAKPRRVQVDKTPMKLALRELAVRGALTLTVEEHVVGMRRTMVAAGHSPGPLSPALARLLEDVQPLLPGPLEKVIQRACLDNRHLVDDVAGGARRELTDHGLIERRSFRRLGVLPAEGWIRTASGDAWARSGQEHLDRLTGMGGLMEQDADAGLQAAADAGAMTLMVPEAMDPVSREQRRRGEAGSPVAPYAADTSFAWPLGVGAGFGFDFDGVDGAVDQGIDSAGAAGGGGDFGGGGDSGGGGDFGGGGGDGGGGF